MENKGKIIGMGVMAIAMVGVFLATSDDSSPAPKPNPTPKAQTTVTTQNGPSPQAVQETIVIKEPDVLRLEALPSLTIQDKTYIRNLALEEEKRHQRTMAEYNRDLAKLNNEIESFGYETGSKSGNSGSIGSVGLTKSASPQMATTTTTETVAAPESSPEADRLFIANQAFSAIELKSLSSSVDGTPTAWIVVNGGLMSAEVGKVFGDFYIQEVTDTRVIIAHAPTHSARAFGIDGVQLVSSTRNQPQVSSPIPQALDNRPISVNSIRENARR